MAGSRNRARTYKPKVNETINHPIQEEKEITLEQEIKEIEFEENFPVHEEEVSYETFDEIIEEKDEVIIEDPIVEVEHEEEKQYEEVITDEEELPEIHIPKNDFIQKIYDSNEKSKQYHLNNEIIDIPHYKVKRNTNDGSLEIINTNKEKNEDMSQTVDIARKMLSQIEQDIIKNSLEIKIHEEIVKDLIDQNEIHRMESKIDVLNKQIEYLEQRKKAINKIIGAH